MLLDRQPHRHSASMNGAVKHDPRQQALLPPSPASRCNPTLSSRALQQQQLLPRTPHTCHSESRRPPLRCEPRCAALVEPSAWLMRMPLLLRGDSSGSQLPPHRTRCTPCHHRHDQPAPPCRRPCTLPLARASRTLAQPQQRQQVTGTPAAPVAWALEACCPRRSGRWGLLQHGQLMHMGRLCTAIGVSLPSKIA